MSAISLWQTSFAVARYDLQGLRRERGVWVLFLSLVAMAWFAIAQGHQHQRAQAAAAAAGLAQTESATQKAAALAKVFFAEPDAAQFKDLRSFRNPADVRGYAFGERVEFAVKPGLAGASLAIGQSDVLPAYVRVRAESMDGLLESNEIEHPLRLAAGRLDLSFVVIYLWPLVLVAITASAVTAKREDRRLLTLRLQGVGHGAHAAAQVGGRGVLAAGLFALAVSGFAWVTGAITVDSAGATAFAQWLLVFAAYTVLWLGVATLIAARAASRGQALFAGFGAWLAVVIVVPATLTALVDFVRPLPSREGYLLAVRAAGDQVNADRVAMAERFYDQHPEWRPRLTAPGKVAPAVLRLARAAELERALAPIEAKFEQARIARDTWIQGLRWISPASVAHDSFAVIAGNDAARHARFVASVRQHQLELRRYFQARLQKAALADEANPCRHITGTCADGFGFTDHLAVPRFAASPALAASGQPHLALWGVLLMGVAFAALGLAGGRVSR